jgi:hypothetical protein
MQTKKNIIAKSSSRLRMSSDLGLLFYFGAVTSSPSDSSLFIN